MEKLVRKRLLWFAIVPMLLFCGVATAQYPILDEVADRVIQKYQGASCEELWRKKYEPKPEREQQAIVTGVISVLGLDDRTILRALRGIQKSQGAPRSRVGCCGARAKYRGIDFMRP